MQKSKKNTELNITLVLPFNSQIIKMFKDFYHHSNVKRNKHLLYHLLFWIAITTLYYLTYRRLDTESVWILVSKELFSVITIFYTISYIIIPRFLLRHKAIYLFIWLIIAYFWWALCTYGMCFYLKEYGSPNERLTIYVDLVLGNGLLGVIKWHKLPFYILDFVYFTSLPLGMKFMQIMLNERIKSAKLERDNLKLEINFLKSQINPHFLFNTLNNIFSMINTHDKNAGDTVLRLSSLMQYTLYQSNERQVPLEKELRFIQNYLELERIRYGEKIKLNFDIRIPESDYGIVPLILFPFIENAFKHGPDKSSINSWIDISLKLEDAVLDLKVSNSTMPVDLKIKNAVDGGIGIENVLKRLELNYSGLYDLSRELKQNCYEVRLTIKLSEYRNLREYIKSKVDANKLYNN